MTRSQDEIEAWLIERLRAYLGADAPTIEPHLPFSYYGLDSLDAVAMAAELETWLGEPIAPDIAWDYPTVSAVAAYLASEGTEALDPGEVTAHAQAVLAEIADDHDALAPTPRAPAPEGQP
jgi:acyl carrier protein